MTPRRSSSPWLAVIAAAAVLLFLCFAFALAILFNEWRADCFRGCYSSQTVKGSTK